MSLSGTFHSKAYLKSFSKSEFNRDILYEMDNVKNGSELSTEKLSQTRESRNFY